MSCSFEDCRAEVEFELFPARAEPSRWSCKEHLGQLARNGDTVLVSLRIGPLSLGPADMDFAVWVKECNLW